MKTATKKAEAVKELLERGAANERREDRHGDTRTGWWLDGVYLGKDPVAALRNIEGN